MSYEVNAGILLRQLAEKSVEVAEQRAVKKDLSNAWSGIGFSLCGQTVVAPMGEVVEIITLPRYTLVPAVKSWMLGVANIRGRLLPIVDIENFFGGRLGTAKSNYRVLIIETQNTYVGLLVSKVFGLKHFDTSSFSYPTDEGSENIIDQPFTKFVDATCTEITGVWYKLSPARLVVDKNFINAARANAESGGGTVAAA